jgi:hypothetical protein
MTVESTISRAQYATNGTTGPWTVPFYFLADDDLQVIYTDASGNETVLTLTTGYLVTGAGVADGGTVTTTTAYAAGGYITVLRDVDPLQETDYTDTDSFPADTHERALDRLTMLIQQLKEVTDRALVFSPSDTAGSSLPAASARANLLLGFNSVGQILLSAPTSGSAADLALSIANASDVTKGAALVGFTLNAIGATARDLYSRGNDLVFSNDFPGMDATGVADSSSAFQAAITATRQNGNPVNAGKTLVICKGTYKCNAGLTLGTGQRIVFEPGVVIDASGLPDESTSLFTAANQAQIYLEGNGAQLKGARASANAAVQGSSAAIYIYGSDNVVIRNFRIQDFATDGITITGDNTGSGPCTNIVIENCYVTNSRRNGMSIISAKGCTVIGGEYTNSNGGSFGGPWTGIDIEPNANCFLQGVTLLNVRTSGNLGGGIALVPGALSAVGAASTLFEVSIIGGRSLNDGDYSANNRPALSFINGGALTNTVYGQVSVRGFVVDSPGGRGVSWTNWDADKCPRVVLDDVCVFDPDYSLNAATNINRSGFVVSCDSSHAITSLGNIVLRNCLAQDRRGSVRMAFGTLVQADATKVIRNVRIENPRTISQTSSAGTDAYIDAVNTAGAIDDVDVTYTTPKPFDMASNFSIAERVGKRQRVTANSVLVTLPLAARAKGCNYEVECAAGVTGLTITAQAGETIKPNGAAAALTYVVGSGDAVRLRSKGGTQWMLCPTV